MDELTSAQEDFLLEQAREEKFDLSKRILPFRYKRKGDALTVEDVKTVARLLKEDTMDLQDAEIFHHRLKKRFGSLAEEKNGKSFEL